MELGKARQCSKMQEMYRRRIEEGSKEGQIGTRGGKLRPSFSYFFRCGEDAPVVSVK